MASYYSDIAAVQAGGVNYLASLNNPQSMQARMENIQATVTTTTGWAAAETIYLAKIQPGAVVDIAHCAILDNGVGATTCTISVGDTDTKAGTVSASTTRYSAALDLNAASAVPVTFSGGADIVAPTAIIDEGVWLTATIATLTGTATAGRKIIFNIPVLSVT